MNKVLYLYKGDVADGFRNLDKEKIDLEHFKPEFKVKIRNANVVYYIDEMYVNILKSRV